MNLSRAPGVLPPGLRVYAIGDVHGCADRLIALHGMIEADLAVRPIETSVLIHLGDYIDRGPDSAGVLSRLAAGAPVPGVEVVNLMGNHEQTMMAALDGDAAAASDWLYNGGVASLTSWGIGVSPRERWRVAIPAGHQALLRSLALHQRIGGYLFVHAGVRPGIALARQSPDDLLTIRQMFLTSEADFGAIVVHGHTPAKTPTVRANRIGIDTGAVFGGPLTCVVLEADQLGFLQA